MCTRSSSAVPYTVTKPWKKGLVGNLGNLFKNRSSHSKYYLEVVRDCRSTRRHYSESQALHVVKVNSNNSWADDWQSVRGAKHGLRKHPWWGIYFGNRVELSRLQISQWLPSVFALITECEGIEQRATNIFMVLFQFFGRKILFQRFTKRHAQHNPLKVKHNAGNAGCLLRARDRHP